MSVEEQITKIVVEKACFETSFLEAAFVNVLLNGSPAKVGDEI